MFKGIKNKLEKLLNIADQWLLYLSLVCSIAILFNLGYITNLETALIFEDSLRYTFYLFGFIHIVRLILILSYYKTRKLIQYGEILVSLYFLVIMLASAFGFILGPFNFHLPEWIYAGIFSTLLISISKISLFFDDFYFNPTILFVL